MAFALALFCASTNPASAYIGPSFLSIPGIPGVARHANYTGWIRAEANYWYARPELPEIRGIRGIKNDLLFTGPVAPAEGPNVLNVAIDKSSPAYAPMMALCRQGSVIPEARFAEDAEFARHPQEHGPRPAGVPAWYEYALSQVRLTCPEVSGAPEQAFGLKFARIAWLNYRPQPEPLPITVTPPSIWPAGTISGSSRYFAVSWFAAAVDAHEAQCPKVNAKPAQEDYFALLPAEVAQRQRAALKDKGVGPELMRFRGPAGMEVTLMPGIVADPGFAAPVSDQAPGFDLDGDDGSGARAPGVRKHRNFVSPDGRNGIDNQLFTVEGCVEGLRRKGFLPMIFNEGRAAGRPTALIEISGIDDERNDAEVWVTVLYSADELRRSPAKIALADYTYRITRDPAFAQDFARFRGRIVNGVVETDPIDRLHIHEVTAIETTIHSPRMRLQMQADGRMKGTIGGYLDWRKRVLWQVYRSSDYENTVGVQAPAIYNAMKRAADGMPDLLTGEYLGISAAFDIEGVPAFVPPDAAKFASKSNARKVK